MIWYLTFLLSLLSHAQLFVTQLFVTLMDRSTPGSPVLYYLLEFAQIHVQ